MAVHTATGQDSCERDHESEILDTNSIAGISSVQWRLTARVIWWLQRCQQNIQSFRKMLFVDSVKRNSEPLTWPVRKNEKQPGPWCPGPWCLACTWNLSILILKERSILCEESTHRLIIDKARKFSCSAREESQRRRLHPVAARVLHELGTCPQS